MRDGNKQKGGQDGIVFAWYGIRELLTSQRTRKKISLQKIKLSMQLPSIFKTYKKRQFTYIPRFYDPVKEEREERRKRLGLDPSGSDSKIYHTGITRGSFREGLNSRRKAARSSSLKIVLILIILIIILFYLFSK